jgi:nicotinamidase-related amidase
MKQSPTALALDPKRAALLVIDIQDRLAAAMPQPVLAQVVRDTELLLEAARRFALPVVVSQQYPKGLGATLPAIEHALVGLPSLHRFDKLEFSACAAGGFAEVAPAVTGRDQWIVVGMEAHVCVYQSVRQLLERGATVHVPEDAVISRSPDDQRVGLRLMERAGALLTSTEVVVFDLLGKAGGEDFKALSRLVRDRLSPPAAR